MFKHMWVAHFTPETCVTSTNETLNVGSYGESHFPPELRERFLCRGWLFEGEVDGRGSADVGVAAFRKRGEVFMRVEGEQGDRFSTGFVGSFHADGLCGVRCLYRHRRANSRGRTLYGVGAQYLG